MEQNARCVYRQVRNIHWKIEPRTRMSEISRKIAAVIKGNSPDLLVVRVYNWFRSAMQMGLLSKVEGCLIGFS